MAKTRAVRGRARGTPHVPGAWAAAGAVAAVTVAGLSSTASAQEFCVKCTGPTAVYRCVVEQTSPNASVPMKALCITTLAQDGHHDSCSIGGGTVFDCNGPIKRVKPPGEAAAPPNATQPAQPVAPLSPSTDRAAAPPSAPQPEPKKQEPPKTVEELAKQMSKSTQNDLQKAGDAIGGAAKKTWGCIASFFKSC